MLVLIIAAQLYCNTMEDCFFGVNFDPAGINNKLTDQGNISTHTAWKNKVVNNSTINDPDSLGFKYNNRETFYIAAKEDDRLLHLGTHDDIKYQSEFDRLKQTNIGKYSDVNDYLTKRDYVSAMQKLSAIVDDNLKEENLRYVNSVIAVQYDPYLDADSDTVTTLSSIANLHPFYGGEAVYMARAILHWIIQDHSPVLRKKHNLQAIQNNTLRGQLHPNPATNEVVFTLPHSEKEKIVIKINDDNGKELAAYNMKGNEIRINIERYLSETYFVHVYLDGIEKEIHRLVIIH